MAGDPDPREAALTRLDALERELAALEEDARRLAREIQSLAGGAERVRGEAAGLREQLDALPPAQASDGDRLAGARIVALELALGGVARDEAVLQLAADFPDVDAAALVDEAIAQRS
jgi:hypothetical protein